VLSEARSHWAGRHSAKALHLYLGGSQFNFGRIAYVYPNFPQFLQTQRSRLWLPPSEQLMRSQSKIIFTYHLMFYIFCSWNALARELRIKCEAFDLWPNIWIGWLSRNILFKNLNNELCCPLRFGFPGLSTFFYQFVWQ
jgi:hypothetical protein